MKPAVPIRLLASLDAGASLTMITAPAGTGKTTLLNQWQAALEARGQLVISISVNDTHPTVPMLWQQIVQTLAQTPEAVSDAARLDQDARGFTSIRDVPGALAQLFGDLVVGCVLIIDQADRLDGNNLLEQLVKLARVAPHLRIVLAKRRPVRPPELHLLLGISAEFVDAEDLTLSSSEAIAIIENVSGRAVPPALGELVHTPMSARLVAIAIRTGQVAADDVIGVRRIVASATLDRLGLEQLSDSMRRFLIDTAVPSAADLAVTASLGWGESAGSFYDQAEALGLGRWEQRADGEWFIYTQLLREALLRQFDGLPASEQAAVRRTVSLWAADSGKYLESLDNALSSGDFDLASKLTRRFWFPISQAAPEEMIRILKRQRASVLADYPTLSMLMAIMLLTVGQRVRAYPHFRRAAATLSRSKRNSHDRLEHLWLRSIQSLGERFADDFAGAEAHSRDLMATIQELTAEEVAEIEESLALLISNAAWSQLYGGTLRETALTLESGLQYRLDDDNAGWYHCASLLTAVRALQGHLADARRLIAMIDAADVPQRWRVDLFGIPEQIAQAIIATAELDTARAQEHLDSIAFHLGNTDHWPYFVCTETWLLLLAGRRSSARSLIDASLERGRHPRTSPSARQVVSATRGLIGISAGHLPSAKSERGDHGLGDLVVGIVSAHCQGRPRDVLTLTSQLKSSQLSDNYFALTLSALVDAVAFMRLGMQDAARSSARAAFATLAAEEMFFPLTVLTRSDLAALIPLLASEQAAHLDRYLDLSDGRPDLFPASFVETGLTNRESVVLAEFARWPTTKDVAAALEVSPNTVKVQLRSAYRKLGVSTREDALLRAAELGLYAPPADGKSH